VKQILIARLWSVLPANGLFVLQLGWITVQHQEWNSNYDHVGQQEKQPIETSREMPESTKERQEGAKSSI
jgi:hypothetical protein